MLVWNEGIEKNPKRLIPKKKTLQQLTQEAILRFEELQNYDFQLYIKIDGEEVAIKDAAHFCEGVNQDKNTCVILNVKVIE